MPGMSNDAMASMSASGQAPSILCRGRHQLQLSGMLHCLHRYLAATGCAGEVRRQAPSLARVRERSIQPPWLQFERWRDRADTLAPSPPRTILFHVFRI